MISKLRDENTANIEKAKSLTTGLSAAQMNWRPQPGKWSIAQNLAHLNFGYPGLDTIASSIAAARAKGIIGNGPFRYGWLSSWIMKSQEPPPKRKFKAAKVNTPSPDVDAAKALVSRPSEKFRFEPSRKFLLTAVRLKDGTNCDEPRGTR